jgi:transcriptional regulator with XRE-family HTH domain
MIALAHVDVPPFYSNPAIHSPAPVTLPPPSLPVMIVGTGGVANGSFYLNQCRYLEAVIERSKPNQAVRDSTTVVEMMQEIKNGFGRTMTRLPAVFGVSRQTLYNWLRGETPKDLHREKLHQLVEAANVFSERNYKPASAALDRTVAEGKSLLQLLAEGADGRDAAEKFLRVVQRGERSRARLDELLGGRKARLVADDIGAPALDESL